MTPALVEVPSLLLRFSNISIWNSEHVYFNISTMIRPNSIGFYEHIAVLHSQLNCLFGLATIFALIVALIRAQLSLWYHLIDLKCVCTTHYAHILYFSLIRGEYRQASGHRRVQVAFIMPNAFLITRNVRVSPVWVCGWVCVWG